MGLPRCRMLHRGLGCATCAELPWSDEWPPHDRSSQDPWGAARRSAIPALAGSRLSCEGATRLLRATRPRHAVGSSSAASCMMRSRQARSSHRADGPGELLRDFGHVFVFKDEGRGQQDVVAVSAVTSARHRVADQALFESRRFQFLREALCRVEGLPSFMILHEFQPPEQGLARECRLRDRAVPARCAARCPVSCPCRVPATRGRLPGLC